MSVKKAFVKAERTRIRLLCSEEQDFLEAQNFFRLNLLRRGYPSRLLDKWFTLELKPREPRDMDTTIVVKSEYNPVWEYINIRSLRDIFEQNTRGIELPKSLKGDFLLSLRKTRNMYDLFSLSNMAVLAQEASLPE
jgi:hypothetical protein